LYRSILQRDHCNNDNEVEAIIAALVMERLLGEKQIPITNVADSEVTNWVKNRKNH